MYDVTRIVSQIEFIETYLRKLDKINIKSEKDLDDDLKYLASSMAIFTILNGMIELAENVVRENGLGSPIEYKDLFLVLSSAKIISSVRAEKLADLVRQRNRFAHRYEKLTKASIMDTLNKLKEVKEFIRDMRRIINKK